jgi:hypothetical protein
LRNQLQHLVHGLDKRSRVTDQMIGEKHQKRGVSVTLRCLHGARCNRRCRIPGQGLKHDRGVLDARLQQVIGSQDAMVLVRHDDRYGHEREALCARSSAGTRCPMSGQFKELPG